MIVDKDQNSWLFYQDKFIMIDLHDDEIKKIDMEHKNIVFINYQNKVFKARYNAEQNTCITSAITDLPMVKLSCGYQHTILISENNEVYIYYKDTVKKIPNLSAYKVACSTLYTTLITTQNELAIRYEKNFDEPNIIKDFHVAEVACGEDHIALINDLGEVFVCGDNYYGQLGLGSVERVFAFTKIDEFHAVKVTCGDNHTMFIDRDDNVFAFGNNRYGQLGLEHDINANRPIKINNFNCIKAICKNDYSMLINRENKLFVCGSEATHKKFNALAEVPYICLSSNKYHFQNTKSARSI